MQITQELWFFLFFIDFFLMGFVGVYAFYTYYKHRVDLKKIQLDALEKSEKIMEETRKKSLEVLEKVEHKTQEILAHSQLFKSDMDKEFKESLKNMADKYLEVMQEHSKKFSENYQQILLLVKDQSLAKSKQALENIEAEIKNQLEESKSGLKEEMMKSLAKANEEISQYKVKELAKVDEELDKLVVDMAKDLLRINLSTKDHKKLIIQALDKAKEQGAFFL